MSTRDELTRQAQRALTQGRQDLAIQCYQALALLRPVDWTHVKQLADLLERDNQRAAAAEQVCRYADHLFTVGFHARAAALFKKVLKLDTGHEHALWQLGEVSGALGLRADARHAFQRVLEQRLRRDDQAGVAAVRLRLAQLDSPANTAPSPSPSPELADEPPAGAPREADVADVPDPAEGEAAPAPVPAEATVFDWSALLGRELDTPAPATHLTAWEEIDLQPTGAPPPTPRSTPGLVDEEIDLTDLVEQLRQPPGLEPPVLVASADSPSADQDAAELDAAFVDLQRHADGHEVADQQIAAGRVFLAAGLISEAAGAFERASLEPRVRFDATRLLGELHRSRGQFQDAVRWFEQAALAPVHDAATRRALLYDLAESLEALGDTPRAVGVLLDLLSQVKDYRDARARVDRLLRASAGG